jgi:hypothetical protein
MLHIRATRRSVSPDPNSGFVIEDPAVLVESVPVRVIQDERSRTISLRSCREMWADRAGGGIVYEPAAYVAAVNRILQMLEAPSPIGAIATELTESVRSVFTWPGPQWCYPTPGWPMRAS